MPLPNLNAGPKKNLEGPGRARNTQTSNATKNGGGIGSNIEMPKVGNLGSGFSSAAGITSGLAGAWAALQNTLGAMRSQRVGAKAAFKTERANIRGQAVGAMSEAINAAIENGMTGSSSASQERIGVLADRRSQIEAAATAMKENILQSKIGEAQAVQQFEVANYQAQMQERALQQQQAIADAALAAQKEGNANMLAWMESQGETPGPQTITYKGQDFEATPVAGGKVLIGSQTFNPSDTAAIRKYLAGVVGQQRLITAKYASGRMS